MTKLAYSFHIRERRIKKMNRILTALLICASILLIYSISQAEDIREAYDDKTGKLGFMDWDTYEWRLTPQLDEVRPVSEGLWAVQKDGLWGFVDEQTFEDGVFVVDPQFIWVSDFDEGWAVVLVGTKFGYIDRTFNDTKVYVVDPIFDEAESLSHGIAKVKLGGRWGLIDQGTPLREELFLEPQFDEILICKERTSDWWDHWWLVKSDGKWGYISINSVRDGRIFEIRPQFSQASCFTNNKARISRDGRIWDATKMGLINNFGE